ncbi:MAG: hypothetical protein ACRDSL_01880 [Pseudonocardiaceae bacterium]
MSLPFTLHPLTPPVGSRAVPAEFDEAAAIFARAQAAYERGAYREAAGLFLSTAGALHVEGDYAEACTAGRTVSYWNAILATLAAGDADGARQVATSVAQHDPECTRPVAELLGRLESER